MYRALRGTKGTLSAVGTDSFVYLDSGINNPIGLRVDSGDDDEGGPGGLYNPTEFVLTLPSGVQIDLKEGTTGGAQMQWIKDLNGNVTRFGTAGIRTYAPDGHELRAALFGRDSRGFITSVTDARGQSVRYNVDGNRDLLGVTNRVGNTTRFTYDARHFLQTITDARGVPVLAATYDDGRLVATRDAGGKESKMSHSLDGRNETLFDRLGNRTVMYYDTYGNVVTTTRFLDGRAITTRSTYDLNSQNPDQPTSVTQYLENGHAITTQMQYDGDGNVTRVADALGHVTVATYANSRVTTVRDARALANGYTTVSNGYDGAGNLLSSTDALGHTTSFTYYANGTPQSVTDAQGHTTRFALDGNGNITGVTDTTGHVTSFGYDQNGNKTRTGTTRTLGYGSGAQLQTLSSQVSYDGEDRPVIAVAPDGVKSRTVYNALGQVERSIRALDTQNERTTTYFYDALGQRYKTISPDGGVTTTDYDDAGRTVASFDRVGRGGLSEYDSLGRVVKSFQLVPGTGSYASRLVKDAAGNALYSQTRYDDLGRAVASRDTQGRWSYTSYDDAGNVLASKDPLGHVSSSSYDELNRAYQSTDAKGHTTTSLFDNAGRQYKTTFADGTSTSTVYDELNRAVGVTDQLGKTKTMHYDALARMDWIEMPVSSGQVLRTRFGFNELGQKTWQQDARGVGEDAASGLNVNVAAPQSRVTRFGYDVRGRLSQRVMPGLLNGGALAENLAYNELGQLVRKRDFRGYWTSFDYDGRGRLVFKSPDPALQEAGVSFSYPDEFTTTAQRGLAKTVTHQDPSRGWMSGIETQAPAPTGTGTSLSTLSFAHDAFGRTQSQTLQSGLGLNLSSRTTSFGYDGLDRLQSITSDDGQTWGYDYDEVGNKALLTRPNGTQTGYAYDSLNRLTALATRKGAALVSRFDYHLRADGKRDGLSEQVVQPDGTTTSRSVAYQFDLANRLTGESGTDGAGRSYSKTYNLDNAGNRLASSFTLDGALQSQATYSYNSLDWMNSTSVQSGSGTSNTTYGYDANGAQTSQTTAGGTSAQTWDFDGHLRAQGQVDASGNWNGPRNTYNYDASGMRLTQAAFNAAGTLTSGTSYVWNGDRVAEERDQNGVLQGVYEHGQELGPLRLRRLKDGAWQNRFFIGDGQDSTRQLLNEAGVVTDSYFYDSFGNALNGGQG